jgi:DNA-binding transcriptional LysR family regulator
MTISLEGLRVLDTIERTGSFAAAARELDRVPSALTYLVRKLEGELDVLLFDRRGRRSVLTPAGSELLKDGRELLRAADELERHVRQVATGWEVELRIAVDRILRFDALLGLVERFYREQSGTRIRVLGEVLSGTWDALVSQRADLGLGTSSSVPAGAETAQGFPVRLLGQFEMVFAVAPGHPLASAVEPIPSAEVRRHRAVAVADTARRLPAATVGLLGGQDVLTVSTLQEKVQAQVAGLGCGYLPLGLALAELTAGRLVARLTAEARLEMPLYYAWRGTSRGRALRWFIEALEDPAVRASFMP